MGNKNEGYLGGIMGGESRVLNDSSATQNITTQAQTTIQDLTLESDLSLVGSKVQKGNAGGTDNASCPISTGSGYRYLEVRYNASLVNGKWFVLGLIESAVSNYNTQGQHSYSRAVLVDDQVLQRGDGSSLTTINSGYSSLDHILSMLLNKDTGDVYISICDPGGTPAWVRSDNTVSTVFNASVPTFSGLDLSTLDTLHTQLSNTDTYMNFNFGGNPLFDGEESSGNDSSTWYNDPPVSASPFVSGVTQTGPLKVANTGILSLEEAGTQVVGDLTLPQLSWGGITGRSVLTEGSAAVPGDDNWDDVTLLLDGTSTTTDVSGNNNLTNNGATISTATGPFTSTHIEFDGTDHLSATSGTGSNHMLGTGDWTVETWVRFDNFTDSHCRVWEFGPYNASGGFRLNQDSTTAQMAIQSYLTSATGSTTLSTATWYHLAVTRSGDTFTLYLDGQQEAQFTHAGYTMDATAFRIGAGQINATDTGTNNFIAGDMADFRITKGVARYTAAFTPPTESFPTNAPSGTPGDDDWNDVSLLIRGDTQTDLSGNAHTLTFTGATANDQDPVKFATGSLYFDGSEDYITVPDAAAKGMGSSDFTVEGWFRTASTARQFLLGDLASSGSGTSCSMFMQIHTAGDLRFLVSDGTTDVSLVGPTSAISTNTWHHIAAVRSGSTLSLYLDGVLQDSGAITLSLQDNAIPYRIGRSGEYTANSGFNYNGNIEDLRITKGVARYTSNFTPPTESFPTSLPATSQSLVNTGIFTLEEIYELTKSA